MNSDGDSAALPPEEAAQRTLKRALLSAIGAILDQQIAQLSEKISSAREAAKQEEKSSAGDKYETTRAMMHLEEEMFTRQRATIAEQRAALVKIDESPCEEITLGALTATSRGLIFFSLGLGTVEIDGRAYLCLSPEAPISRALWEAEEGDTVDFRGELIEIFELC